MYTKRWYFLARKVNFRWKSWLSWKRITSTTSTSIRCILRRFEDRFSKKNEIPSMARIKTIQNSSPGKQLEVRSCVRNSIEVAVPTSLPPTKKKNTVTELFFLVKRALTSPLLKRV